MHVVGERAHDLEQIELASEHRVQFHASQQQCEAAIAALGNLAPDLPE
jgi:hypothetical protein